MVATAKSMERLEKVPRCNQRGKVSHPSQRRGGRRNSRKAVTLNDFMSYVLKSQDKVVVSCYNVEGDGEQSDEEKAKLETNSSSIGKVAFFDEDLLLGLTPHNRSLYVIGYSREERVNRLLIDNGSTVNIMPLRVMKELGIPLDEVSANQLMIQRFNRDGHRALEKVRVDLFVDDLKTNMLIHVIDVKRNLQHAVRKTIDPPEWCGLVNVSSIL